jgi:hypothetical protein
VEQLRDEGTFWLPEAPDRTAAGTLTFDIRDGGRLSLIGSLRNHATEDAETEQRIVGRGFKTAYTLLGCWERTYKRQFGLSQERQVFTVGRVLSGLFTLDAIEDLEVSEIGFDLGYLNSWMRRTGIDVTLTEAHNQIAPLVETRVRPIERRWVGSCGVELRHGYSTAGDVMESFAITQHHSFRLILDGARPLDEAIEVASDLQDLISIGLNRTAEFGVLSVWQPDFVSERHGRFRRHYLDLYAQWFARDQGKKPQSDYDLAFTFNELGGMDGIDGWMRAALRFRKPLGRVMATRYREGMFTEDRLANRVAALEGLHRLLTGKDRWQLRRRLRDLTALAGPPFQDLVGNVEAWIANVLDTRDRIAHDLTRRPDVANPADLWWLSESTYWLFVLCILREANAPTPVFDHISRNPDFVWLRGNIHR